MVLKRAPDNETLSFWGNRQNLVASSRSLKWLSQVGHAKVVIFCESCDKKQIGTHGLGGEQNSRWGAPFHRTSKTY